VPAAEMSDAYSRETLALKQEVESYVNADLYDPERPKIVAVRGARCGAALTPSFPTRAWAQGGSWPSLVCQAVWQRRQQVGGWV
jgi:hypothetical protein